MNRSTIRSTLRLVATLLRLAGVVVLTAGLVALGSAAAQEITHGSSCNPDGSAAYAVGESILFTYQPSEPEVPPPVLPKLPLEAYPPCVDVTLTASGVTGRPPFEYKWRVDAKDLLDQPTEIAWLGNPVGVDTGLLETGVNTVTLVVSNDAGEAVEAINLWVPHLAGPIPAPVADQAPSPDLVVTFSAQAPGAHEWQWDFGDGTVTPWTVYCDFADSTVSHTYAQAGTYAVVAYARNCRAGTLASEPLQITVGEPAS